MAKVIWTKKASKAVSQVIVYLENDWSTQVADDFISILSRKNRFTDFWHFQGQSFFEK